MNDFNCSCVPGYTGKNCSIGKPICHVIESCYLQQLIADLITTYTWAFQNHFHDLLLSIMRKQRMIMLKCPVCYKKLQNLQLRLNALIIDSFLVNFCKTIFVSLACFFVCLFV